MPRAINKIIDVDHDLDVGPEATENRGTMVQHLVSDLAKRVGPALPSAALVGLSVGSSWGRLTERF